MSEEEATNELESGFQINWMILRDADTGNIIWQENQDFSSSKTEHQAYVPVKILDLRAVSREINFSTITGELIDCVD